MHGRWPWGYGGVVLSIINGFFTIICAALFHPLPPSCFISDLRLLLGLLLVPMAIVLLFNTVILTLSFRIVANQNRKKFISQGGERRFVKMGLRSLIALFWLTVLFGVGWVFGLLTIREASKAFQYLFVITNAFQGFYFFIFICLNQQEARTFWANLLTNGRFKSSQHSVSKGYGSSSDYKRPGKHGGKLSPLASSCSGVDGKSGLLTLPNPSALLSSNDSVLDQKSLTLESVCEGKAVRPSLTAVHSDSVIEVTTYFNGREENENETESGENSFDPTSSKSAIVSDPASNDGGENDDQKVCMKGRVKFMDPYMAGESYSEVAEEDPKSKKKSKVFEEKSSDVKGLEKSPRALTHHKNQTAATSATTSGMQSKTAPDDDNTEQINNEVSHNEKTPPEQGDTAAYTENTGFSQQRLSRQKKVTELEAPFMVVNPLCAKEE